MTNNDNVFSLNDRRIIRELEEEDRNTVREIRYCEACGRDALHRDHLTMIGLPESEMHCLGCLHREWRKSFGKG